MMSSLAALSLCKVFTTLPADEQKEVCCEIVLRCHGYSLETMNYMSTREKDLFILHRFAGVSKLDYEFMRRQLMNFPLTYLVALNRFKKEINVTTSVDTKFYSITTRGELEPQDRHISSCYYGLLFNYQVYVDGRPLVTVSVPNIP